MTFRLSYQIEWYTWKVFLFRKVWEEECSKMWDRYTCFVSMTTCLCRLLERRLNKFYSLSSLFIRLDRFSFSFPICSRHWVIWHDCLFDVYLRCCWLWWCFCILNSNWKRYIRQTLSPFWILKIIFPHCPLVLRMCRYIHSLSLLQTQFFLHLLNLSLSRVLLCNIIRMLLYSSSLFLNKSLLILFCFAISFFSSWLLGIIMQLRSPLFPDQQGCSHHHWVSLSW